MADTNVTVTGNLTRDPELRFTTSGKPVANCGIAVNRLVSKPGEERKEEVSFFDFTAWDSLATNLSTLAKGTRVTLIGDLRQRSWETDEGDKRSKVEITAQEIGVSIRWATVEVMKNAKASDNGVNASVSAGAEEPF